MRVLVAAPHENTARALSNAFSSDQRLCSSSVGLSSHLQSIRTPANEPQRRADRRAPSAEPIDLVVVVMSRRQRETKRSGAVATDVDGAVAELCCPFRRPKQTFTGDSDSNGEATYL